MFKIALLLFPITALFATPLYAEQGYKEIPDENKLEILSPFFGMQKIKKLILDNGMQVLLISDPTRDESGAALALDVGSWQDPAKYPGMAHLMEHMLFLGTETHKTEKGYQQFIKDKGGYLNAFTSCDKTVYSFSIDTSGFSEALDLFSHFFIDPLLDPDAIKRELNAVNAEHEGYKNVNGRRVFQVLKETSNPAHPFHLFSTGNRETLEHVPQAAMRDFFNTYYRAGSMHLILISSDSLDTLTKLAVEKFSKVKGGKAPLPAIAEKIFSKKQEGHMLFIESLNNNKQLEILWELPRSCATLNGKKMAELLVYSLASETDHSLAHVLKAAGLATQVTAGSYKLSKENLLFEISVSLTDLGVKERDQVIARCFEACARIKKEGIPETLFQEQQIVATQRYNYQDKNSIFDTVSQLGSVISDENLATFPQNLEIASKYDPATIKKIAAALIPEKALFTLLLPKNNLPVTMEKKERWMGVPYAIVPIDPEALKKWEQLPATPLIELPGSNPYISKTITPVKLSEYQEKTVPTLLINDQKSVIYYAKDQQFFLPKTALLFSVYTPKLDGSQKSFALGQLFNLAFNDLFADNLFYASTAGIRSSFQMDLGKVCIYVEGFNPTIYLKDLTEKLCHITPSKEQFEKYKISLKELCLNSLKNSTTTVGMTAVDDSVLKTRLNAAALLQELDLLSYEDLLAFNKTLFDKTFVEGMIYGAIEKEKASQLCATVFKKINRAALSKERRIQQQVLQLPEERGPFLISKTSPLPGNATVLAIEEGPFSYPLSAMSQLLSNVLEEEFFDQLRTKQQTGYRVASFSRPIEKEFFQYLVVESATYNPDDLLGRFDQFLERFLKEIDTILTKKRFESIKQTRITKSRAKMETLLDKTTLLNDLAFNWNADFDHMEKKTKSFEELDYDKTIACAKELFSNKNRRRIAALVWGKKEHKATAGYEESTVEQIRDDGTFKKAANQ